MTYLANEFLYRNLMLKFIQRLISAAEFEQRFFEKWRVDRDEQWELVNGGTGLSPDEQELGQVLDQTFTALDCYTPNQINIFDISEVQLRSEITELFNTQWPAHVLS